MKEVYLDYGATTPVDKRVFEAMAPYMCDMYGNASSVHKPGRDSRAAIEQARGLIAEMINCDPIEVAFTSGGTEADNHAIKGAARADKSNRKHIVTCVAEHHASLYSCKKLEYEGYLVTYIPISSDGMIDLEQLRKVISKKTVLVSIMHVNNEIGTINDIAAISALAHEKGALFHTDAVQSFGKVPIDVEAMNIDLLAASSHKIYGPKGAGFLFVRKGAKVDKLLHGGSQENNRRAGTENVPAIVGFCTAAEICRENMTDEWNLIKTLRDHFWNRVNGEIVDVVMNGHPDNRLTGNLNVSFAGVDGESLLLNLDLKGIAASSGSACNAGGIVQSHVIKALRLPKEYDNSAIRFTLGRFTTKDDIDYTVDSLKEIINRIRNIK